MEVFTRHFRPFLKWSGTRSDEMENQMDDRNVNKSRLKDSLVSWLRQERQKGKLQMMRWNQRPIAAMFNRGIKKKKAMKQNPVLLRCLASSFSSNRNTYTRHVNSLKQVCGCILHTACRNIGHFACVYMSQQVKYLRLLAFNSVYVAHEGPELNCGWKRFKKSEI